MTNPIMPPTMAIMHPMTTTTTTTLPLTTMILVIIQILLFQHTMEHVGVLKQDHIFLLAHIVITTSVISIIKDAVVIDGINKSSSMSCV